MILFSQYKTHFFDINKEHLYDEYPHKVINILFSEYLYCIAISIEVLHKRYHDLDKWVKQQYELNKLHFFWRIIK